jgi:hypothetical protein
MLISSACIDHGNTSVQDGETQLSITQYTAEGLFKWVPCRFQSAKTLVTKDGKIERVRLINIFQGWGAKD